MYVFFFFIMPFFGSYYRYVVYALLPFRSLNVVQILDVQNHLLRLFFCCLGLLLCQFKVSPYYIFQRFDIHLKSVKTITKSFWQPTLINRPKTLFVFCMNIIVSIDIPFSTHIIFSLNSSPGI